MHSTSIHLTARHAMRLGYCMRAFVFDNQVVTPPLYTINEGPCVTGQLQAYRFFGMPFVVCPYISAYI